jgi:hypothetical protein
MKGDLSGGIAFIEGGHGGLFAQIHNVHLATSLESGGTDAAQREQAIQCPGEGDDDSVNRSVNKNAVDIQRRSASPVACAGTAMALHVDSRWAHQEVVVGNDKRRQHFCKRRPSEAADRDVHPLTR